MTSERKGFEQWALVEVMGHQKLAGLVTEETIAGTAMVRVDVPAMVDAAGNVTVNAFTTYLGGGSIYRLTPVSEDIARRMAASFQVRPVQEYQLAALPAPRRDTDDEEDEDFDDEG